MIQLQYSRFPSPLTTPAAGEKQIKLDDDEVLETVITYKTYGDFRKFYEKLQHSELTFHVPPLPVKKTDVGVKIANDILQK